MRLIRRSGSLREETGKGEVSSTQPGTPERVLFRTLRETPHGLTLNECWAVLRPYVGRARIQQALETVRGTPQVYESIETRPNRSRRPERQRVLRVADSEAPEPTAALPAMETAAPHPVRRALLVATHGPNTGRQFPLNAERNVAGRHPRSEVLLGDTTVSRRHAEFDYDGETVTVQDAGSRNGTYVNNARIEQATALTAADQVDIGAFRLVFLNPAG